LPDECVIAFLGLKNPGKRILKELFLRFHFKKKNCLKKECEKMENSFSSKLLFEEKILEILRF